MREWPTCTVEDCDQPVHIKKRGLCSRHYRQWWAATNQHDSATYNREWRERNREKVEAYNAERRAPKRPCIDCDTLVEPPRKRCEEHALEAKRRTAAAQTDKKITVACDYCGTVIEKCRRSLRRYANAYCDMACRDQHQAEQRRQSRLPIGPVPRTMLNVLHVEGTTHQPRQFYAGYCKWCDSSFISTSKQASYCSARHGRYAHKNGVDPELARQVYERDDWTCLLCHRPVKRDAHYNDPLAPTVDHIVPKHIERIDELPNLRTAHRRCNELRGRAKDERQLVLAA